MNLSELWQYKVKIVRDIDVKIEEKNSEFMKFIAKYFHVKYLSFIEGATCEVTLEEVVKKLYSEIGKIIIQVNYCGLCIFSFGIYHDVAYIFNRPLPMREFIKYMSDKNTFNLMRVDMRRIYVKYVYTNYLQILPLAVTLTLCNLHRRIFPKDILNIIIKKLFFQVNLF